MENKGEPDKVANSAERQLLSLKKAQDDKIEYVKQERNRMVALRRTLSALIYAAGSGYISVYPQAEGLQVIKLTNGKYKYEPQEQQKKALFKLTGLFEEDLNNFYKYDKESNSFGVLSQKEER